ncbi:mechanosensitive ion channel family protein [Bacillus sp. DNRA2]|uniref:mechanosensitive ion channel family protein n=1 Tax=Bacillus sp. DNRA2 TaxID=2723053 RepID=UPI00145D62B5|nr:mechanosensitive ion channel family protein [Bacillus sp. DNRA2]NMD72488.1 mechanosensitive ion channel family protein [Bacillus sp. DNRA2]
MKLTDKDIENVTEKLVDQDTWIYLGTVTLKIVAIFIISGLIVRIAKLAIKNIFKVRSLSPLRTSERRDTTLAKLLQNIVTYVIYFIAFIMMLSTLNINIGPILAGAGVVGLAVGFGAQNLVKDIITGFFIIFEDQFSVGDYVRIGQFEGDVEEIGLRTTKIKGLTGERHIIPNGSIADVTNFSIHNSKAIVDVGIAYEEDIDRAEQVIRELLETLPEKYEEIISPPQLLGVQNFGPSEVVLRIVAETQPMKHFLVSRAIRKEVKHWLDLQGIEIPFPRLVMYSRAEQALDKQV